MEDDKKKMDKENTQDSERKRAKEKEKEKERQTKKIRYIEGGNDRMKERKRERHTH